MPVIIVARYEIKATQADNVRRLVSQMATETRKEAGNEVYDFYVHPAVPTKLILYERYKDAAAVNFHRESPHFKSIVLEQILPNLESRSVDEFSV